MRPWRKRPSPVNEAARALSIIEFQMYCADIRAAATYEEVAEVKRVYDEKRKGQVR